MRTEHKKTLMVEQKPQVGLRGIAHQVGSNSKWFSKFYNEPTYHIDLGIWARLTRTIVRKGQYTEMVVDPATGRVLHHKSEPLAKHTGHGSDKSK